LEKFRSYGDTEGIGRAERKIESKAALPDFYAHPCNPIGAIFIRYSIYFTDL